MKTASWYTFDGPGRIGISVGTPRRMNAGFRLYRPLNPRREWLDLPKGAYEKLYFALLAGLDAKQVWDDLHQMARGAEPVLLCFERPPFHEGNWCHRRMVADWFKNELGHDVPEYEPPAKP